MFFFKNKDSQIAENNWTGIEIYIQEQCYAFKILLSSHQEMPKSVHGRTIRDTETTKNKKMFTK
jgi:hypothetical protein